MDNCILYMFGNSITIYMYIILRYILIKRPYKYIIVDVINMYVLYYYLLVNKFAVVYLCNRYIEMCWSLDDTPNHTVACSNYIITHI